ncbi:AMP-binding protein [Paracoccus sp. SCSIO 75233]|uniref:AMP-binding protein n=1 Tax=Paracoccus sp. SCSIO 75233 TaxID=3017782 RepID=UPI0022EFECA4|nr:AMP-binding protein [Paracoccus sp. SCSIO 75233]WBU52989.1 AMP-binding protein [Paracoccus sp. SCSIO 75233]
MPDKIDHPWIKAYPPSCHWDANITATTLPDMTDGAVGRYGEKTALVYRDNALSFNEIDRLSKHLAAGLMQQGVKSGEAVGIYLPNTASYYLAFFALARIGARIVNLSPLDPARELIFKLNDTGARRMITLNQPDMLKNAITVLDEGQLELVWVCDEARWGASASELAQLPEDLRFENLEELFDCPLPDAWPALKKEDIAVLQYTGGTTGVPKAAMLSHGNLTAAVDIAVHWKDIRAERPGEERVLGVLPLFHAYAMNFVILRQFREGCCVYLHRRFDAETVIRQIEQERLTVFPGVPTMWIAIAGHPAAQQHDLSSLQFCISGGAPLPPETARRVENIIGNRLLGGWGMTEASPVGSQIPMQAVMKSGIIGVPQPSVEIEVVSLDDPHRTLGANEIGELRIRGPNVFSGYWNRKEETAKAFADGFFLSGDIGYRDENGLLYLVDRKKSLIISGGFNVYPAHVENAIYEHPDVAEVLAVGIPDDYRGQSVKAFITLKPEAKQMTLEALRGFLAERLGRHELPTALEFRAELPRSAAGKLLRRVLEDEEKAADG